jgi:hypothetical protein
LKPTTLKPTLVGLACKLVYWLMFRLLTPSQVLCDELCAEIGKADVIAISIDESAAIDNTEYLSIEIYYPDRDGMPQHAFIALEELPYMDAKSIAETLVGKILFELMFGIAYSCVDSSVLHVHFDQLMISMLLKLGKAR